MKRPAAAPGRVRRPPVKEPEQPDLVLELEQKRKNEEEAPAADAFEIPPLPAKRMRKATTIEDSQISGWYLGCELLFFNSANCGSLLIFLLSYQHIYDLIVYTETLPRSCLTLQQGLEHVEQQHSQPAQPTIEVDSASQASTLQ